MKYCGRVSVGPATDKTVLLPSSTPTVSLSILVFNTISSFPLSTNLLLSVTVSVSSFSFLKTHSHVVLAVPYSRSLLPYFSSGTLLLLLLSLSLNHSLYTFFNSLWLSSSSVTAPSLSPSNYFSFNLAANLTIRLIDQVI